jgi:hypothetical protein
MQDSTQVSAAPPVCDDIVPKQKTQEELEKDFAGADGHLDDIEKLMLKYDEDRSGQFSVAEVKSIVRDLEEQKKTSKHLGRALIGTVFVSLLVLGSMFALMILSIESTKENRTKGNKLVTNSGEPVQVAPVESFSSVFDLPKVSVEQLSYLTFVNLKVKTVPDEGPQQPVFAASFKIGGFIKGRWLDMVNEEEQLHLYTTTGAQITVGPGRTGFLVTSSGQNMTLVDDSEGRRLEENAWLECTTESCEPRAAPEGRRLLFSWLTSSFAVGNTPQAYDVPVR